MAGASGNYVDGQIWDAQDANWVAGFGDGTDGAFSENSGTTNLVQGTVHQYTSFLLDTSATLSASSTSTKPIIIYVSGDCTINGTIDLQGKGCPTSFDGYIKWDTGGLNNEHFGIGARGGYGNLDGNAGSYPRIGGMKGSAAWNFQQDQVGFVMNGTAGGLAAAFLGRNNGGGGGASSTTNGGIGENSASPSGTSGAGGAGGCSIIMIIGGTLTLGASSSIDTSGTDGADGTGRGGGGGGAGDILIFHKGTKTDNGLTTDVTGGAKGLDTGDGDADGGVGAAGQVKIVNWDTIRWGR